MIPEQRRIGIAALEALDARAFEQPPEAAKNWLETDDRAIAIRAKAGGGAIYWGDETAVSSREHYPRGYAPKGKTQGLVLSRRQRERINRISAVSKRGMYASCYTVKDDHPGAGKEYCQSSLS